MARYIGNYEVLKTLGAGHFGTVYLGVGEVPGRRGRPGRRRLVAIKKLKDTTDQESVELLLQEFALLDQVKHRSVVRVFEYIEDEQAVVMEHIHGVDLRTLLEELDRAHEQVFTEAAVEMACEIADGLYQAYTTPGDNGDPLQLVHRDLKPANVMLTSNGEVKILDWGLARVDNADFDPDDQDRIKGTLMYMAPEQARGEGVDHHTDLFALGLMVYELLMNRPVYTVPEGSTNPLDDIMGLIETGDTTAACESLEKELPAIGPIITRALQRRPRNRYRHGQEMMVDLRRQLYRDRGAYLQEFCEFFFGSIYDIGEPPLLETIKSKGRSQSRSQSRLTIEQRLRQSMARENRAQSTLKTPPRTGGGSMAPAPTPPPATGAAMAGRSGDGRPPRPPVGGAASRAIPFRASGNANRPKSIGERSPSDPGMLEMVPLNQDVDSSDAASDVNATQFFAIPAPKADRTRPAAPPPAAAPQVRNVGAGRPPPPPGGRPNVGPPSPIGIGGPPPPAAPLIQGRVANPAAPFAGPQVAAPSSSNEDRQRVQSYRVFALVLGVFGMVCVSVLVAVWFRFMYIGNSNQADIASDGAGATIAPVQQPARKRATKEASDDTGEAPPPKRTTRKTSSSKKSSSSSTSKPAAPAAPTGPAPLTVRLADGSQATSIEVTCASSGFRQRTALGGGVGTINNVPQENCTVHFKGGAPAKFSGVRGGQTVNCSIIGTTATCR